MRLFNGTEGIEVMLTKVNKRAKAECSSLYPMKFKKSRSNLYGAFVSIATNSSLIFSTIAFTPTKSKPDCKISLRWVTDPHCMVWNFDLSSMFLKISPCFACFSLRIRP